MKKAKHCREKSKQTIVVSRGGGNYRFPKFTTTDRSGSEYKIPVNPREVLSNLYYLYPAEYVPVERHLWRDGS